MGDIPDASMAMPTANWYNSLAPEVKAGLYAPYEDASNQMLELMGSRGQTGAASSGYTGAAGAAMGELWADAGRNVGMDAWKMTGPMAMANWQANLDRNVQQWGLGQQEALADYNTAMEAWRLPMQNMSYLPSTMGQAYVNQGSNPVGGMLSGGLMGGLGAATAGITNPWGIAGLAGLGALGGLFG